MFKVRERCDILIVHAAFKLPHFHCRPFWFVTLVFCGQFRLCGKSLKLRLHICYRISLSAGGMHWYWMCSSVTAWAFGVAWKFAKCWRCVNTNGPAFVTYHRRRAKSSVSFYNSHRSAGQRYDGWIQNPPTCDFCRCRNWSYSGKSPNWTHSFWSTFLKCHHRTQSLAFDWSSSAWL